MVKLRMFILRIMTFLFAFASLSRVAAADDRWPGPRDSLPSGSALEQSHRLRLEIEALRQERAQYGIAGPIVMMGVGGGVTLGAAYMYMLASIFDGLCHDSNDCGQDNNAGFRTTMVVVGVAGVALGVWGFLKLQGRLGPRNELGAQINAKRLELRSLESRVRLGAMTGPLEARGLSLTLAF